MKSQCIQRLEFIVEQRTKDNSLLKTSIEELNKIYEDFEFRVKDAEKIAKLKSKMVKKALKMCHIFFRLMILLMIWTL